MKKKNLYLLVTVLAFLVFIGYLSEPGPYILFGQEISIWFIRGIWLLLAGVYGKKYWENRAT